MINREIIITINKYLKKFPVIVILGPRQVGKTTLVNQFAAQYEQYIYLNLELSEDKEPFESILPSAHFEKYMKLYRFKQFRKYVNLIWEDENLKETDEWWRFQPAVDEFNDIRRIRILSAFWMIVDETMSAYRPRTSATGKLPNISYIFSATYIYANSFKWIIFH